MTGYGLTDRGKIREENQDTLRYLFPGTEDSAILVVCDGMGGAQAGELASRLAAEEFFARVKDAMEKGGVELSELMRNGAELANHAVYSRSLEEPGTRGMGTTLVAAIVRGDECVIVNVGDSRAYLIGNGSIMRVTRDHSLVEELVARGELTREAARTHPRKNIITRALGVDQQVKSDIFEAALHKGDILLLCTDGLSNVVLDEEILKTASSSRNMESLCRKLMKIALRRGAPDNVTVLAAKR